MSTMMEFLHDNSLPTIELLQSSFPNSKNLMINISTLLDPRYVFLIYAPILFALNKRVGHRMIIALTLTEWSNQILKWLLAGERPYWYVHERAEELAASQVNLTENQAIGLYGIDSYDAAKSLQQIGANQPMVAQLKQFPVTCELGAGSPSGHAMVTATVWYVLIDAYLRSELPICAKVDYSRPAENRNSFGLSNKLAKLSWSIYTLILISVSLSRVYLACHFPHQCLCGAILGIAIGRLVVERVPLDQLRRAYFALATLFMFATVLATYATLKRLGVDPLWSVDKGMRWCIKKEYIHLDTTPFFSMMRYLGFCLGAGLAFNRRKLISSEKQSTQDQSSGHLLAQRLIVAGSSILFGQFLLALPMPTSNQNLFYAISFLSYTLFSYSIAAPIPDFISKLMARKTTAKNNC